MRPSCGAAEVPDICFGYWRWFARPAGESDQPPAGVGRFRATGTGSASVLRKVDFAQLKEHEIEPIFQAFLTLPGYKQAEIEAQCHDIDALAAKAARIEEYARELGITSSLFLVDVEIWARDGSHPREGRRLPWRTRTERSSVVEKHALDVANLDI